MSFDLSRARETQIFGLGCQLVLDAARGSETGQGSRPTAARWCARSKSYSLQIFKIFSLAFSSILNRLEFQEPMVMRFVQATFQLSDVNYITISLAFFGRYRLWWMSGRFYVRLTCGACAYV